MRYIESINILLTKPVKRADLVGLRMASPKTYFNFSKNIRKNNCYKDILTKDIFKSLLDTDKTRIGIAEELNISEPTVRKYLKKYGLYKPKRVPKQEPFLINQAKLQEVMSKDLSLSEIASELKTTPGAVVYYLKKYNLVTDAQNEYRVVKDYFLATTPEAKTKAFSNIDKSLEQIANDEFKTNKYDSYEDCLQDVRLRFLELAQKNEEEGVIFPRGILKSVRISEDAEKKDNIKTIKSELLEKINEKFSKEDEQIKKFEIKDFCENFWNYIHSHFTQREIFILEKYINEDNKYEAISKYINQTPENTRHIVNKALSKARRVLDKLID